uniref:Uncharacterized protein n=1 Tax=Rhizophora mucronata TaxID=61149 RepID=A0A2P2N3V1_RHIMU
MAREEKTRMEIFREFRKGRPNRE